MVLTAAMKTDLKLSILTCGLSLWDVAFLLTTFFERAVSRVLDHGVSFQYVMNTYDSES